MAEIIYPINSIEGASDASRRKVNNYFHDMLKARLITLNSNVVVYLERTSELIYVIEACFMLGITYIPIDTAYPDERVLYVLEDSKADFIITTMKFRDKFKSHIVLAIDEFDDNSKENIPYNYLDIISDDKVAYINYTSGTSGLPKGVKMFQ